MVKIVLQLYFKKEPKSHLKTAKTPKPMCVSFQIEWRCAAKADRLQVLVDGVEVPVKVGKEKHTQLKSAEAC